MIAALFWRGLPQGPAIVEVVGSRGCSSWMTRCANYKGETYAESALPYVPRRN
jgi:hypothetical protein